jgi:hypothetical protein
MGTGILQNPVDGCTRNRQWHAIRQSGEHPFNTSRAMNSESCRFGESIKTSKKSKAATEGKSALQKKVN